MEMKVHNIDSQKTYQINGAANLKKARVEVVMILNTDSASLTKASKWFCRTRRLDSQGLFLIEAVGLRRRLFSRHQGPLPLHISYEKGFLTKGWYFQRIFGHN